MATILKNNIKPSGGTLKDLVATDSNGVQHPVKFVRQVNGSGGITTLYDTFKNYSYGDISINSFSYDDIAASGGKVTPKTLTYSQSRTQVGESGNTYSTDSVTSGATITYSGTGVNTSTGEVSAGKIPAEDRSRTKITTVTVTVSMNGKTATKTFDVYQAANVITTYGDVGGTLSLSVGDIAASGGTKKTTDVTATKSATQTITYTSGATRNGNITYSSITGADVSANSLTSTEKARTAIKSNAFAITATGEGNKTKTAYATVYQAANAFTGYSYDNPTGLSITCGLVPAGGGSVTSGTVSGTCSQVRRYNYTAGNDQKRDTINPTYTGSWSGGASNIGSRGTTVDTANTSTGKTLTYTYTANSKSNTATCTVYQTRNVADASSKITAYGNVTCSASVGDIPAGGGTVTVSRSASQTRTRQYYYTSGTAGRTASEACTITWNTTDVTATAAGLKSTPKARTAIKTFNYTATGEGSKSNTCSCTAYQAANVQTKNAGSYKSYGTPTISIGSGLTAGGGSATITASVTDVKYYYYTYTDTSANESTTAHYENVAGTVSLSIASQTASRYSISGTTLNHSKMGSTTGTDSVTVRATNTRSTSLTKDASTSVTNTATAVNDGIKSYGTPTVSIGSGITAAGGSATITRSVTNVRYWHYTYTDTSANEAANARTKNEAGTVNLSIVTNGNNRFSLSGTTLSHTSMAQNVTTDSVTIRATNANSTSLYKDASTSVTNTQTKVKDGIKSYGTPTCSIGSGITAGGGSATVSHGVTNVRYYHYTYTSGNNESANAHYENEAGTTTISITSNGNNRFSLSGNTLSHSNMTTNTGTDSVTVRAVNSGSTSLVKDASTSVTNSATKNIGSMKSYGTPTVSIGSGLTAAGGSATVSHGVTNVRYWYYSYTSGSKESTTAHEENVTGTTTISITSNGNNRFSLSGNTLSHSSMGASATTDSVTITAKNSNDTSKTNTATSSVTNAAGTQHYKNTSGTTGDNWTYGTPTNPTLTNKLAANGGTVTISGSTVKNTKTYYLKYTSGSYGSLITETPAGSVAYEISSNGNSRFAFASGSNTTINHSNMTTNATTDTIGVKAYNTSDSSKKSAQVTASVTNSYSDAWNNPSFNVTVGVGGNSAGFMFALFPTQNTGSIVQGTGQSQTGTRTFTSGSTSSLSNSTFNWKFTADATWCTFSETAAIVGENYGAKRSCTITIVCSANGKSSTKTSTMSQDPHPSNGYAYVDLGLPSGTKWATTDVDGFYSWGETTTKSNYMTTSYTGTTDLPVANDVARVKLGGSWLMPTKDQFSELIDTKTSGTSISYNSTNNTCNITKNSKTVSFSTIKGRIDGPNHSIDNSLFWSRSIYAGSAYALMVRSNSISVLGMGKGTGCTVRGVFK